MTWIWILTLAGVLLNGLRTRGRALALEEVGSEAALQANSPSSITPQAPATRGNAAADYLFLVARGVRLSPEVRERALAYARSRGLAVVDLIPSDLPVERALLLVRSCDPRDYSQNRLAPGRGAGHAILVRRDVLERSRLELGEKESLEPERVARATIQLKYYAGTAAALGVLPGLSALPSDRPDAMRFWSALVGETTGLVIGLQTAELALFGLGLWFAPLWALAAILAFQLQPLLVFGSSKLQPEDLRLQAIGRIGLWTRHLVRFFRASRPDPEARDAATKSRLQREGESRAEYASWVAGGLAAFFEARRTDCPWCGAADLVQRLVTKDFFHHKPGRFRLDRCEACGHVFQNPRLSIEGLDFYYKDFYGGAWEGPLELAAQSSADLYTRRAETLQGLHEPRKWLDVGTGQAHFCIMASAVWPGCQFDGLDMSEGVEEAQRRGWISKAYRQMFPDVAPKLTEAYDVVSMHHYLEHTLDPRAELDAAAHVLAPGGMLQIEVPDPEYPLAALFGRRWASWFQPQHLHFVPLTNLRQALEERHFEVVRELRATANLSSDVAFWLYTILESLAPPVGMPWQPARTPLRTLWRIAVLSTVGPAFVLAFAADRLLDSWVRRFASRSNTYRIIARKGSVARKGIVARKGSVERRA